MHNPSIVTASALALAVIAATTPSFARDEQSIRQGAEPSAKHGVQGAHDAGMGKTLPTGAQDFVEHAAEGGMAEVALGKLAVSKATDQDVKEFAQKMVDDHSKANAELTSLAKSKSLEVPTEPNAKHKAEADSLSKLSGAAFDKAYMTSMVADHDHDVAMFRNFSERGDDTELKAWAGKTLPTLQDHERLAKTTASKVGVNERTGSTGMGATHGAAQ
ncbi:MAG: DUF4142 domain-containing protein [Candidatus Binatia bacterium]